MDKSISVSTLFLFHFFSLCLITPSLGYPEEIDEDITPQDKLIPQCPSRGSRTFLRYKGDNDCYEANKKGPCGENMILFPHPSDSGFGFCDCFDARGETTDEAEYLNDQYLSHCIPEIRGQIYVPERHRCYSVFHQGPCSEGKWLVLNATFYPVCAKNTCRIPGKLKAPFADDALSPHYTFTTSTNGKCYLTMTQGHCANSYELRFSANHFVPQCRYIPSTKHKCPPRSSANQVRKLRCKPGSRYDHLTSCSRSINPR